MAKVSTKQTPPPASTRAAEKVFTVPELLENILKHLPIEDLFRFQRVNSTFCDLMKTSKSIRRAMHLDVARGGEPPKESTDLFGHFFEGEYTFTSPALMRGTDYLQIVYSGIEDGCMQFRCQSKADRYFPKYPKRGGSWRRIKIGWEDMPIKIQCWDFEAVLKLTSAGTLGNVMDWFSREWNKLVIEQFEC